VASYFVDGSALVKRYVNETGSAWLSGLVASAAGNDIYIARITTVEVIAALTRRARSGTIAATDASAACLLFRNDLLHDYEIVNMTETLLNHAMTLAETGPLLESANAGSTRQAGIIRVRPRFPHPSATHTSPTRPRATLWISGTPIGRRRPGLLYLQFASLDGYR